ncbi:GWxTD domain-containing protein [candidate division KSB1 bacterium]|nr:GWxTD domain-containing protein [candidate division KSB1 bacterium]
MWYLAKIYKVMTILLLPFSIIYAQTTETATDTSLFAVDSTIVRQVKSSSQTADDYIRQGQAFLLQEDLEQAIRAFKSALTLCDTLPEVYNYLGIVELEKADFPIKPVEKIMGLLKFDHKSRAIRYFRRALALNPSFLDAKYNLTKAWLLKGKYKQAEAQMTGLLALNPDYKDSRYLLGRIYQAQNKLASAIDVYKQIAKSLNADGRECYQLAWIYFQIDNQPSACSYFYQALELLNHQELADDLYDSIVPLLTREEKAEYQSLPLNECRVFFKKFWKSRDPSPETDFNERLIEHFRRVEYSRIHFPYSDRPYFDDRGVIYIRYGPPQDRYTAASDQRMVKGNESWSYEHVQRGLVFDFVEKGAFFILVPDLRDAAPAGTSMEEQVALAGEMYMDRSHLSDTYTKLAADLASSPTVSESMIRLAHLEVERVDAEEEATPEFFVQDSVASPMPAVYRWSQFQKSNDSSQVVLYLAFPSAAFHFEQNEVDSSYESDLKYAVILYDSFYDKAYQDNFTSKISVADHNFIMSTNFIFQKPLLLETGNYDLQLLVETLSTKRKSIYKEQLPLRQFTPNTLQLSDVMPASHIEPASNRSTNFLYKNDLLIVPYPFKTVQRKNPLFIYYEIYNLLPSADGRVFFTVDYTFRTIKAKKSILLKAVDTVGHLFGSEGNKSVTTRYERTGTDSDIADYISFDLSNQQPGVTELQVTITDVQTSESVSDTLVFNVVK